MMPAACRNDCRSLIRWPRYELPVPEHPGFGGSDDPPAIHSVPDLATFYLDRVEEGGGRPDPYHRQLPRRLAGR
jgi:hypothetical protein